MGLAPFAWMKCAKPGTAPGSQSPHKTARSLVGSGSLRSAVAVSLDYAENIYTATVMALYPARTPMLEELAPFFNAGKWLALSASFMLLAIGVIIALTARWRRRSLRAPVRVGVRRSECSRSASSIVTAAQLVNSKAKTQRLLRIL